MNRVADPALLKLSIQRMALQNDSLVCNVLHISLMH